MPGESIRSAWHRTDRDRSSAAPRSRRAHRCRLCTGAFSARACCDTSRRPGDGTKMQILPGRIPGAHYEIPGDLSIGATERRVSYQVAYRLRMRCRGSRQNSSPTASHWRTFVRPGNRPEAMMDQQHGMCLAESLIAPFPEIDEADLGERERPEEWPIGRLNRAWSDRLAPENGSQGLASAWR